MVKKYIVVIVLLASLHSRGQEHNTDTLPPTDLSLIDTSLDYDELLNELELFMDSILAPRSYLLTNLSVGQGYFNYISTSPARVNVKRKYTFTPTVGYYGRKGLGITLTGYMIREEQRFNMYQFSISPSYDYLSNRDMALGVAYIRYFTKDSVKFYTSPLQNELSAYFLWRKSWVQPGIALNYGQGSNTAYQKRLRWIERLGVFVPIVTTTKESIVDFSATASVRHDFYWLALLSEKDYLKFTPMIAFTCGTQKFGFNQTTGTYGPTRLNVVYNAGNVNLDKELKFQPLSVTVYLRPVYNLGKFFVQPQLLFDYYFPARENNFSTLFSVNTGFTF